MPLQLQDDFSVTYTLVVTDQLGNPTTVDGAPVWSVSDDTILAVIPAADGLSCRVEAAGALGVAQINVSVDADRGAGTTALTGSADIEVVAGNAAVIALTADTPVAR